MSSKSIKMTRAELRDQAAKLPPAMCAWLLAYLDHGDGVRAYRDSHPRASEATARRQSTRMRAHPAVGPLIAAADKLGRRAADRAVAVAVERYEHTQARVLLELHHIAYVDTAAASLKSIEDMTDAERRALKGVERTITTAKDGSRVERLRYIWHDKIAALKLIGIPLRMWEDAAPPPPPVAADQQPATGIEDARAAARQRVHAFLERMAEPAPLEGEVIPPRKPNGNGHAH